MGSTAVIVGTAPGHHASLTEIQGWAAGEYPAIGTPEQTRDKLNELITAAGIASHWTDETSGVRLPHGVGSITFSVHAGLVRSIWINRPTGELLDLLTARGPHDGWRVFDADSDTEYGGQ
ncbi:hypothetical protein ACNQVK_01545 [Mycobacterium sp. 134]|uniref:hypothetical protein n=1 Tax=Mycobacterium sp. 134 TaxID=3400425 RepID=UPI003AAC1AA4